MRKALYETLYGGVVMCGVHRGLGAFGNLFIIHKDSNGLRIWGELLLELGRKQK